MTMKFHRVSEVSGSTPIEREGSFETPNYSAKVQYEFNSPSEVFLTIDSQYFQSSDLDDLIAFLTFAKTQVR